MATRIRGKTKQTLKSLKIKPETSRSESRALANWATTAPKGNRQTQLIVHQPPIVQRLAIPVLWMNLYPVQIYLQNLLSYSADGDLSTL